MKRQFSLLAVIVTVLVAGSLAPAQSNPFVGTWKLNVAASVESRINAIVSGATQFVSTMILVEPSRLVTMLRQPAMAPSSVALSVCERRP